MQVSDFHFELPSHLIAKYPRAERASSRLMHLDAGRGDVNHYGFHEIVNLMEPGDLMVFNDTRVIPARLYGNKKTGGKVELLLERVVDTHTAMAQAKTSKGLAPGSEIKLSGSDITLIVEDRQGDFYSVIFPEPGVLKIAGELGHVPLPPYIDREDEAADRDRYQTVYASRDGAVAAPTAGLHFDDALLQALAEKGVDTGFATLHVGAGTFQPVRVDNIEEHRMHEEYMEVDEELCRKVDACRSRSGRVIAVGTTSVRCLETASDENGIAPYSGDTNIFIYPGYEFKAVDVLLTNFHLPGSTLLMLVSAFAGINQMKRAYEIAIEEQYRFFSYGDAMLITR